MLEILGSLLLVLQKVRGADLVVGTRDLNNCHLHIKLLVNDNTVYFSGCCAAAFFYKYAVLLFFLALQACFSPKVFITINIVWVFLNVCRLPKKLI